MVEKPVGRARSGAWARAQELAALTPASRNRYVDFLRAASILVVVGGHWIMAAPMLRDGRPELGHVLELAPWIHWLTWVFQVMPTFFLVGGFANATSWESVRAKGQGYAEWLQGRISRLIGPMVPLLLVWIGIAAAFRFAGISAQMVQVGSRVALVPIWFLAVYLGVVLVAPWTFKAWRRWGLLSFAVLAAAALAIDYLGIIRGMGWLRWVNYACVWIAVHQLGYAWRDGRLAGVARALPWGLGGLAVALAAVKLGPYPVAMVGVPGEEISNTLPPTFALLAFGTMQVGLVLCLEAPVRRWLAGLRAWAATVLINANIMTLYLWHSTALVLFIGLLLKLGGPGLSLEPGSGTWWLTRPLWLAILLLALWPFLLLFSRFERPAPPGEAATAWRLVVGVLLMCFGIAVLALLGIGGANPLGVTPIALLPLLGARLARIVRPRRMRAAT
ncbi:MAG: acyltransferase family protein [Thermoanaerobaculia bacterium]